MEETRVRLEKQNEDNRVKLTSDFNSQKARLQKEMEDNRTRLTQENEALRKEKDDRIAVLEK